MCMYVCMYVCMSIYVYVHVMFVCTCIVQTMDFANMCIRMCVKQKACVCVCEYMGMYVYVFVCMEELVTLEI